MPTRRGVRTNLRRAPDATDRLRAVLATRSARELVQRLEDPSPEVVRAAIGRLVDLEGERAIPPLRSRLLTAERSLVAEIARALARIPDPALFELAVGGLGQEPYTRRVAAARALAVLGEERAVEPLRAALGDRVAAVRAAALEALGELGAAEVVGDCARLLADGDPNVRVAAVQAVRRLAPHAGPLLAPACGDADRMVRVALARHTSVLPADAATRLLADHDERVREAAAQAAGVQQLAELAGLLRDDPHRDVRLAAAHTLGRLGAQRSAGALIDGLEDRDPIVRAAALRALESSLQRSGAIALLREGLCSPDPGRRRASLFGLSHLGAVEAGAEVSGLADDPDPEVRLALVQTAEQLLGDPEPLLRYLARDSDRTVRDSAQTRLLRRLRG